MKVIILDIAEAEFDAAIQYYERERPGLGRQFFLEVSRAIGRIIEFPEAYRQFGIRSRRCLLAVFPYAILYQYKKNAGEIVILAIGYLHRRPEYWSSRTI